jgi:hypothetical protein
MYPSTFTHMNTHHRPAKRAPVVPPARKAARRSATLPSWRNHLSLLRTLVSHR